LQPPPFRPTLSLPHKFRFVNGANSGSFGVARAQLLNLLLTATSAVTTVRLIQAVRLKKVEVWTNPVALGSPPTTCSVEWLGENAPSTVVSDISMGVRAAHVRTRPPPRSSDRWWCLSGQQENDLLFELVLPANCVIDVTVELRFVEAEAPTAGDVPAGAVLGTLYGDYLDGIGSGKLSPVGYNVIP